MAGPGAMADFARLPAHRKALVFVAIGGLLGALYWGLAYQPLDHRLEAAQAEHDRKLQTRARLAADLPRYEELRARIARLREVVEKNQAVLPSAPELPAFFEALQRKAAASGVEIHKWTKRSEVPVETFVKVPIEIEMTGTFLQIKRFFASLIQHDVRPSQPTGDGAGEAQERAQERIVSIEDLALTSPTVEDREVILTAKFTAVTFRQDGPPAARPGSGRPTVRGAAPETLPLAPLAAPSPAPPPLPSTATPAGASARRAGDAVDREDPRADKAKGEASDHLRLRGGL